MSRLFTLEQVENQIVQIEALVETRARIQRMSQNSDFKELINKRYLVEEAAAFAASAGDPAMTKDQREEALSMALAPGHLKRWLSVQVTMANTAEDQLPQLKHARDVLRAITDAQFEAGDYTFDMTEDQN